MIDTKAFAYKRSILMPEHKSQIVVLFKQISQGDTGAFDELFLRYYDKLLAFALQYTKQLESAEEITSELFVKIWLRRDGLSHVLNPEVYLFIAIKNASLNFIRSTKKREMLFAEQPDDQMLEKIPESHATIMEERELSALLDQAVAALPDQRRRIFKLIKEDGLKSHAVAEILGLSVRTVDNQLYKAVKTLAESISGYLGYHPQKRNFRKPALSDLLMLYFL